MKADLGADAVARGAATLPVLAMLNPQYRQLSAFERGLTRNSKFDRHPRPRAEDLDSGQCVETEMAGTSPAMTVEMLRLICRGRVARQTRGCPPGSTLLGAPLDSTGWNML